MARCKRLPAGPRGRAADPRRVHRRGPPVRGHQADRRRRGRRDPSDRARVRAAASRACRCGSRGSPRWRTWACARSSSATRAWCRRTTATCWSTRSRSTGSPGRPTTSEVITPGGRRGERQRPRVRHRVRGPEHGRADSAGSTARAGTRRAFRTLTVDDDRTTLESQGLCTATSTSAMAAAFRTRCSRACSASTSRCPTGVTPRPVVGRTGRATPTRSTRARGTAPLRRRS